MKLFIKLVHWLLIEILIIGINFQGFAVNPSIISDNIQNQNKATSLKDLANKDEIAKKQLLQKEQLKLHADELNRAKAAEKLKIKEKCTAFIEQIKNNEDKNNSSKNILSQENMRLAKLILMSLKEDKKVINSIFKEVFPKNNSGEENLNQFVADNLKITDKNKIKEVAEGLREGKAMDKIAENPSILFWLIKEGISKEKKFSSFSFNSISESQFFGDANEIIIGDEKKSLSLIFSNKSFDLIGIKETEKTSKVINTLVKSISNGEIDGTYARKEFVKYSKNEDKTLIGYLNGRGGDLPNGYTSNIIKSKNDESIYIDIKNSQNKILSKVAIYQSLSEKEADNSASIVSQSHGNSVYMIDVTGKLTKNVINNYIKSSEPITEDLKKSDVIISTTKPVPVEGKFPIIGESLPTEILAYKKRLEVQFGKGYEVNIVALSNNQYQVTVKDVMNYITIMPHPAKGKLASVTFQISNALEKIVINSGPTKPAEGEKIGVLPKSEININISSIKVNYHDINPQPSGMLLYQGLTWFPPDINNIKVYDPYAHIEVIKSMSSLKITSIDKDGAIHYTLNNVNYKVYKDENGKVQRVVEKIGLPAEILAYQKRLQEQFGSGYEVKIVLSPNKIGLVNGSSIYDVTVTDIMAYPAIYPSPSTGKLSILNFQITTGLTRYVIDGGPTKPAEGEKIWVMPQSEIIINPATIKVNYHGVNPQPNGELLYSGLLTPIKGQYTIMNEAVVYDPYMHVSVLKNIASLKVTSVDNDGAIHYTLNNLNYKVYKDKNGNIVRERDEIVNITPQEFAKTQLIKVLNIADSSQVKIISSNSENIILEFQGKRYEVLVLSVMTAYEQAKTDFQNSKDVRIIMPPPIVRYEVAYIYELPNRIMQKGEVEYTLVKSEGLTIGKKTYATEAAYKSAISLIEKFRSIYGQLSISDITLNNSGNYQVSYKRMLKGVQEKLIDENGISKDIISMPPLHMLIAMTALISKEGKVVNITFNQKGALAYAVEGLAKALGIRVQDVKIESEQGNKIILGANGKRYEVNVDGLSVIHQGKEEELNISDDLKVIVKPPQDYYAVRSIYELPNRIMQKSEVEYTLVKSEGLTIGKKTYATEAAYKSSISLIKKYRQSYPNLFIKELILNNSGNYIVHLAQTNEYKDISITSKENLKTSLQLSSLTMMIATINFLGEILNVEFVKHMHTRDSEISVTAAK